MTPDVRIGISGWTYKPWRGQFYPKDLPQKRELSYAGSVFRSIEINGTFYSMQRCESFAQWADATPDDFVFAVKGPRYLTHMLKLNNAEAPASALRLSFAPCAISAPFAGPTSSIPPLSHPCREFSRQSACAPLWRNVGQFPCGRARMRRSRRGSQAWNRNRSCARRT